MSKEDDWEKSTGYHSKTGGISKELDHDLPLRSVRSVKDKDSAATHIMGKGPTRKYSNVSLDHFENNYTHHLGTVSGDHKEILKKLKAVPTKGEAVRAIKEHQQSHWGTGEGNPQGDTK